MGGGAESFGVEKVKTCLRHLTALCLSSAIAGCAFLDWRSAKGSEENWQEAYLAREAQFTLRDGSVKTMSVPRDFGPAVCAFLHPCIAKADIVSVRWYRQTDLSRAGEYTGQVAAVALLWPITLPYAISVLTYQPNPAPERPADWSYIPDSCGDREAGVRVAIQDAAEAAQWVEANKWSLGWFCLSELSRLKGLPMADGLKVELETMGSIRAIWNRVRCVIPQENFRAVTTSKSDASDPRRGPPGYFDTVTRLLRDPRTWDYDEDLADICQHKGGVAPEGAWAARKARMRVLHPFPPAGFEEQFP